MDELWVLLAVVVAVCIFRVGRLLWQAVNEGIADSDRRMDELNRFAEGARQRRRRERQMRDITPTEGVIDLSSDQYRVVDQ